MRPHILVVEDEQHIGVGIKYNLEAEEYRVTLVEDGPTALKLIESSADSIDLIVLDLMLPGMSGYAVCERMRDDGCTVPVLMLSARTLPEDRTRGFDVGANQYMNKPFELDELISRVKNLLQINATRAVAAQSDRPGQATAETRFGGVYVNFNTYECEVDGKDIRLTSKEVRLLRYFVDNPGRVISRSELLSEVWDMTGNLQTRAVDQFIARLRKIIEPDSSRPVHLLTIRDAGYRFLPEGDADQESDSA